jgi:hypothetical protein
MIYPQHLAATSLKLSADLSTWNSLIFLVNRSAWRSDGMRCMRASELLVREHAAQVLTKLATKMLSANNQGKAEIKLKLSLTEAISLYHVVQNIPLLTDGQTYCHLHELLAMLDQFVINHNHLVDIREL